MSRPADVSATGRYVVFVSSATNLVAGDTNALADVFLRDTIAKTTRLVSKGMGGVPTNGWSYSAQVSADGRYVVYSSAASNLVPGDTNDSIDVFRVDMTTGVTTRVTKPPEPTTIRSYVQGFHMSDSGMVVEFVTDAPILNPGVYGTGTQYARTYVSGGGSTVKQLANPLPSYESITDSALSADGKFAALSTDYGHVFIQDLALTKVSTYELLYPAASLKDLRVANGGFPTWIENRMVDGRWVGTLHVSAAAGMSFDKRDVIPYYNWVDISRWGATVLVQGDKSTTLTVMDKIRPIGSVTDALAGYSGGSISSDAKFVAYTNAQGQVRLWNLTTGTKVPVSVSTG